MEAAPRLESARPAGRHERRLALRPDPFGTYRFKNGAVTARGQGYVVFTVKLTEDGSLHRARFGRFGGDLPKLLRRKTRYVLREARYRFKAGQQPLVESVWPDGSLQATRLFNPLPVAPARC